MNELVDIGSIRHAVAGNLIGVINAPAIIIDTSINYLEVNITIWNTNLL